MVVPTSKGRCCITDPHAYYQDSITTIAKRFELYREIGVDTLRVEISWRDFLDDEEGAWNDSRLRNYLQEVRKTDFRLKMIVGTIMAPPGKFLERVPEARLINEDGVYSRNTISYWYPGLSALLKKQLKRQLEYLKSAGLLERTDYIIADFGPAGEPIYPAAWTMGGLTDRETFWCYDANAQNDFRKKMQAKYRSIVKANATWSSSYKDWAEVSVLKPGTTPGKHWEDVLTWYRDKKRAFIQTQLGMFQALARSYTKGRTRVLVYIPGSDIRPQEWEEAIRTGSGSAMVRLMCDSRWLIDTAVKKSCVLQYTGMENRPEVEYLKAYLDKSGHKGYPLWGENAGDPGPADNPMALAQTIVDLGLIGLDYTHSHFVFEKDGITPNARFAKLREAYALLRKAPT
ncbi:MAG: beta-galactosidase [Armatimonas sp.]